MLSVGYISSDFSSTMFYEDGHPIQGGACHYRCLLPAEYLRKNGTKTVLADQFFTKNGTIQPVDFFGNVYDCDIIVFQRWMDERLPEVIQGAKAAGQIVLQDVDDYFWGMRTSNVAWQHSHPKFNPKINVDHYWKSLGVSSAITVSTEYLKTRLQKLNIPIYVINNAVELSAFKPNPFMAERPTLGWLGSTALRSGDIEILKGILGPFLEKYNLGFFHLGSQTDAPTFAELAGLPPESVSKAPLAPMAEYPSYFSRFDVGIVPLADTSFSEAKSFQKGLEHAAAGVPFLASSSSEYQKLDFGLICKRPKDWIRNLERIVDPEERQTLAKDGLEKVKAYDIETRWSDWQKVYTSIAKSQLV